MVTHCLGLIGAQLGDADDLMGPGPDNASGYSELRSVKEINDRILAHLGGSWDCPPPLSGDWALDPTLDPWREIARSAIDKSLACVGGVAVMKDPRFSVLLPFWKTVVSLGPTVTVVRSPDEVVASLHKRNQIPADRSAGLWLRYVLAAEANDPAQCVVNLDDFYADPGPSLRAVAAHIGLPAPNDAGVDACRAHIDPGLRHHAGPAPSQSSPAPENSGEETPLLELARQVFRSGGPSGIGAPVVSRLLADGTLSVVGDSEALASARSEVVGLSERLRMQRRSMREMNTRMKRDQAQLSAMKADKRAQSGARRAATQPAGRESPDA